MSTIKPEDFLRIMSPETRCRYCDSFYVQNVEFYGPANDKFQRNNEIRFVCPYCAEKGIQKKRFRLISDDKIKCVDVSERFKEEMQAHQEMESLIEQMINEVSIALTCNTKGFRHYSNYITVNKMPFYGDFIYSTTLQRPPDPINHLNDARSYFESMEMGHCPNGEKRDWIEKAISHLKEIQTELKYTHRNLY
jgi:hypothetical protein